MLFKTFVFLTLITISLFAKPNTVVINDDWYAVHYSCMNNDLFIEIYRIEDLAANNETYGITINNNETCKMPYHSKAKIQWKEIYNVQLSDIPKDAIVNKEYKYKLQECSVTKYLKYGNNEKFFCHTTKLPTEKELKMIISNSKFWTE
jgi:hypothetical protein